jgi:hypothetical protein
MAERLPDGITREHLPAAIEDLDHNAFRTSGSQSPGMWSTSVAGMLRRP